MTVTTLVPFPLPTPGTADSFNAGIRGTGGQVAMYVLELHGERGAGRRERVPTRNGWTSLPQSVTF